MTRKLTSRPKEAAIQRKLVAFDEDTLRVLNALAQDSMRDFQELADEAFRDLLKKHDRPVILRDQLRRSARLRSND